MKKVLFIVGVFISTFLSAQKFELTPDNYKNKDDETKDYVVIEFSEMTQKQLFEKTKTHIHSQYNNLKSDGFNEVEFSQLKLKCREVGMVKKIFGIKTNGPDIIITYEIKFKDGRLMIKPTFDRFEYIGTKEIKTTYLTGGSSLLGKSIFNKKNKIWLQDYYNVANDKVNEFVDNLKKAISKKEDW